MGARRVFVQAYKLAFRNVSSIFTRENNIDMRIIFLQLRNIEEPLQVFLAEYDNSLAWISENEVLLKPVMASDHLEKHKELIEVCLKKITKISQFI